MFRKTLLLCILGAVLAGGPARAQEADEPVVARQLYDISGRFMLVLSPDMTVVDKYTRNVGVFLAANYFFTDWLGLELEFGYQFLCADRKLLNEILATSTSLGGVERLPLEDLKRMVWGGHFGLILSPLYGKLNFSAELAVNLHLYLVVGAGVAQYKYSELKWNMGAYTKHDVTYTGGLLDGNIQPTFNFGGGLMLHVNRDWGLRIELRDVFFYDDYQAQVNDGMGNVKDKTIKDFNHITFLKIGVVYAF